MIIEILGANPGSVITVSVKIPYEIDDILLCDGCGEMTEFGDEPDDEGTPILGGDAATDAPSDDDDGDYISDVPA